MMFVNPNNRKYFAPTRPRMLMRDKVSMHVETVVLLSKGAKDPVDLCSARTEVERRMVDSRKVKVDFSLENIYRTD